MKPDVPTSARFLAVDLTDRAACERELGTLDDLTHVVYTALYEQPRLGAGWIDAEHERINLEMLRNLVEVVDVAAPERIGSAHDAEAFELEGATEQRDPGEEL